MIFPRWPEFIVDFNVFVITAYPELYENYVFSRIPKLDSSESDCQGAGKFFFFYFLDFLSGFATKNSNYLHTDRQ